MTDIILKQGTGVPSDTDVDVAEVAIDTSSGAMYTKLADGSVKHLNPDGGGSGGASSWNDLTDKPAEFPPEAHTHEIADVDGLQDALDAAGESLWKQNGDDIYYNDGNVGIGTDSPSTPLTVNGTTDNSEYATFGNGNQRQLVLSSFFAGTRNNTGHDFNASGVDGTLSFSTVGTERMRIDAQGRVGIGTDSPAGPLEILKTSDGSAVNILQLRNGSATAGSGTTIRFMHSTINYATAGTSEITALRTSGNLGALTFSTSGNTGVVTERMRIDDQGRVGIGGQPSRSIKEIEDEAEATLRNWDSKDKKPTKAELIKRLTERTIGGGNAKLQVAGDGYFSGNVTARSIYRDLTDASGLLFSGDASGGFIVPTNSSGVAVDNQVDLGRTRGLTQRFKDAHFSGTVNAGVTAIKNNRIYDTDRNTGIIFDATRCVIPCDGSGVSVTDQISIGRTEWRFKDAHFSGTIYGKVDDVPDHVKAITPTQIANWDAGTGGGGGATTDGRISDDQIVHWDQAYSWGNHASAGYQPAGDYLTPSSLNGYATQSWVSSNYQPKGNYQPAGNYLTSIASGNGTKVTGNKVEMSGSYTGTFTATGDIVAYSDVRLKENIRTLDGSKVFDMRGVSFERDGKPSSGVIAQELQEIAPELVHDDGEHLGVAYGNLVGYLIEAVKELKAEVEELKRG